MWYGVDKDGKWWSDGHVPPPRVRMARITNGAAKSRDRCQFPCRFWNWTSPRLRTRIVRVGGSGIVALAHGDADHGGLPVACHGSKPLYPSHPLAMVARDAPIRP